MMLLAHRYVLHLLAAGGEEVVRYSRFDSLELEDVIELRERGRCRMRRIVTGDQGTSAIAYCEPGQSGTAQ